MDTGKRQLLLVGWDAADWTLIHPLLDKGELPNLQRLVEAGVSGNLATMQPILSPILWTSIATGKTGDEHRILGFLEPDPLSGGARPVTSGSRRGKAIWNILHQAGCNVHAVNWFASHPAEPIRGVCVANAFCHPVGRPPEDAVHPRGLYEQLNEIRIAPADLSGSDLAMFVRHIDRVDQTKDHRLRQLALFLSEAITVHGMATWILETQPWDFVAFYMDFIDHAGHVFMKYHPPAMEGVPPAEAEIYGDVMNNVYRFHDLLLGRLMLLAGPDATIMIVSDHGFHSGVARPTSTGPLPIESAMLWHREQGVLCVAGPGIRHDELVHGARLLDIAPTILALYGLPLAADMPGRPLLEIFETPPELDRIPSWDEAEGDAGMHPPDLREDPWDAAAAMEQLAALGYVEAPSQDKQRHRDIATGHQTLNLARVLVAQRRTREAIPLFEELVEKFPKQLGTRLFLLEAYLRTGERQKANNMVERVIEAAGDRPLVRLLQAQLAFADGDHASALTHLMAAEETQKNNAIFHDSVGHLHYRLGRPGDAEAAFRKAIRIEPQLARSWRGLAGVLLRQGRRKEAAEAALEAVGLDYQSTSAHFLLGSALAQSGYAGRAAQAFEVCLKLKPGLAMAHAWLAAIHEAVGGDAEKAAHHREKAREIRSGAGPQPAAAS